MTFYQPATVAATRFKGRLILTCKTPGGLSIPARAAVAAGWIPAPPLSDIEIAFTPEAEAQLRAALAATELETSTPVADSPAAPAILPLTPMATSPAPACPARDPQSQGPFRYCCDSCGKTPAELYLVPYRHLHSSSKVLCSACLDQQGYTEVDVVQVLSNSA